MPQAKAEDGAYHRKPSKFRDWPDGPLTPGRYHLYVSWACPWAHRAVIARLLLGLEDVLPISVVDPIRDDRGWAFTGGEYLDPLHGWSFLSEAYQATTPGFDGRISVPVLWDREKERIVNNESADVLRILNENRADGTPDLYPERHRQEIDALNERIYPTVNNGVYRTGFAKTQEAYEEAVYALFDTLDWLETLLGKRRYLAGSAEPTEADWRLFTSLVRFDSAYHGHFKCNRRKLIEYPNLWAFARDLYATPGVAETIRLDEIKRHYYGTHESINPTRIVAIGPEIDFAAPHGREALPQRGR